MLSACPRSPLNRSDHIRRCNVVKVDRRYRKIGVAQLPLDHVERDAFRRQLRRVGVAQAVRVNTLADASLSCASRQHGANVVSAHWSALERAEQRTAIRDAD